MLLSFDLWLIILAIQASMNILSFHFCLLDFQIFLLFIDWSTCRLRGLGSWPLRRLRILNRLDPQELLSSSLFNLLLFDINIL